MLKQLYIYLFIIIILFFLGLSFNSCRKDDIFNEDTNLVLDFSNDLIYFDTVFTTIGSITKQLKIFNPSNERIKISHIYLAEGNSSAFRINVDGLSGTYFRNVEIEKKDSLFIFVEVTVDPNNTSNPMIISDSIVFEINGNKQDVDLVAYGQDAYFHIPNHAATQYLPAYSLVSGTWANDKPHVIYGYAIVDTDSTLIIPAGTDVYLHNSSNLWIFNGGTLKIEGTLGNEVTFQGDRLDSYYKDLPGMWGRIWLSAGSKNNEIDYAIIKNGTIGLHVDTLGNSPNPTLKLKNTIIDNMSVAGIYAQGSYVEAENCLISNCAYYAIALTIGGDYDFRHCTIGNYWNGSRETPSVVINNYYEDINGSIQTRDITAYFGNCIIYGTNKEEILLDENTAALFNYTFENTILKTELDISNASLYINCLKNADPKFIDSSTKDFELLYTSPAINSGSSVVTGTIATDLKENARIDGVAPDMGCYEYVN